MRWTAGDRGVTLPGMDMPTLMLERIDPALNVARYYSLSIEPTLFGEVALARRWGRIGTHGARIVEIHRDRTAALAAFGKRAAVKLRRGYVTAPLHRQES
jgi:predicted DNA-binding WGR domain protein